MNRFKRHPITVLLGIACLLAAFGIGLEYRWLQRKLTAALKPPPASIETAPVSEQMPETLKELPPVEAFSAFVEQPLFIEGRKPLPQDTATAGAEAGAEQKPLDVRLTGIIDTPEAGQIILVQDRSNKTLRFKLGTLIDGWHVAEIKDDQAILKRDGETHVLKLIKPRPAQPHPPAARPPPPPQGQAPNPFAQAAAQQKKE